ncbi:hypothetical protein [Nonomuraea sp. NPDC023979]|uniref:hypothetical protein n=1 Tax=Nonomuraea sp. NPDC023979 TaxID=3154796 RepID=UPI0033E9F416
MSALDRYRVIVRGHSAASTATRRRAESLAELARGEGSPAHVEPTQICKRCELHRCGGEQVCRDAGER